MLVTLFESASRNLPSTLMIAFWIVMLRASRTSKWRMAIVSLPGTWLHELAHWLVGLLLGARPVSFTLWPRREGQRWVLGSVGFERVNIWNAAPVALAPLLLFGMGWWAFDGLIQPLFNEGRYGLWLALGYPVASGIYSGLPSTTDLQVGALSVCMYAIAAYVLWTLAR